MPFKIMREGEVIRVEDYEIHAYLETAIQNDFLRFRGVCHYERINDEEAKGLREQLKLNREGLANCINGEVR